MKDRRTHRSCNPLLFAYRLLPGDTQKTQRKDNDAGLLNHLVEQLGCTWRRRPVALDNLAFLRGIAAPVVAGAGAGWWFWVHPVSPARRRLHRRAGLTVRGVLPPLAPW